MESELSKDFVVNVRMRQESVLSPFYAVVVDVTEFPRDDVVNELLYADDLVLMSEIIEGLRNKFIKWKEAFERKGLKVNLEKTRIMVSSSSSSSITNDGLSKSKVDPCGFCS